MPSAARSEAARPGSADFATTLEPRLRALTYFRAPTEAEVDVSYAAYCAAHATADFARLCDAWRASASAQRATLTPAMQRGYDHAGVLPSAVNAHGFLASVRAVLAAGERFRAALSPATHHVLHHEFPWLEHRHEHVPAGWAPHFDFPPEFAAWIDVPDLDDVRARWQLAAGMNEVQQAHNSEDCARRFRIPELRLHAARERELALNYFGHSAPNVTRALFRECLFVLDALNAAVFAMLCVERPAEMVSYGLRSAITRRGEWRAFVDGLARPQRLMPVG